MASNVLESVAALLTPDLQRRLAMMLGESDSGIGKAFAALTPTLLGAVLQKSGDPSFMRTIMGLLTDSANDPRAVANPGTLLDNPGSPAMQLGGRFLSAVLGGDQSAVTNAVSNYAGIKPASASSLLSLAAPLVMSMLGQRVKNEGLDAGGLAGLLSSQRNAILSAAPGAISSLLGLGGAAVGTARAATVGAPQAAGRGMSFLWPALIGLAVIAGLWMLLRGRGAQVQEVAQQSGQAVQNAAQQAQQAGQQAAQHVGQGMQRAGDAAANVAGGAGQAAQNAAAGVQVAAVNLGDYLKRQLPGGAEINVPERGIESKVVAFIGNDAVGVEPPTWFEFDRILFETGSAHLRPESKEQIANIVTILKAYPAVKVKIGGYTDNTGDPQANLKLSQDRATAVQSEIIAGGIASDRIAAEGYGETHPVADNATETGRAKNRRIALLVVAK